MLDIGERLQSYEPLWENWYKDTYIGGGNFGKVYRLKQNFYGETIYSAVKIIPIILDQELASKNAAEKERYIEEKKSAMVQEIKNMYRLKGQSNIVQCLAHNIKDIYDDNGNVIGFDVMIQMDYYTSLTAYMREEGKLSADRVQTLAVQIASAIRSMHDINMLHRDIKIENIYVDANGDFLLGDFGISKQEETSSYSTLAGTQPFIAPEVWKIQHTNKRYTKTADIYSFGISLYYLLNGNMLPMVNERSTQNDIDNAIFDRLNGKLFPPPPNGSERLKAVVMKCCEYESTNRFQNMNEVIRSLTDQSSPIPHYTGSMSFEKKDPYATVYAGDQSFTTGTNQSFTEDANRSFTANTNDFDSLNSSPYNNSYPNQPYAVPQPPLQTPYTAPLHTADAATERNNNRTVITVLVAIVSVLATLLVAALVLFAVFNKKDDDLDKDSSSAAETTQSIAEAAEQTTTEPPETTTTETTTTTTVTTEAPTETTTAPPPTDAELNGYDEFDTTLIVKVDEADTLPLRSLPNKETSDILLRIPDETQVHVLGYKDTGTEVWFRVEYNSTKGWCRGGMLQPNNLSMLYDSMYDRPGLDKWKAKFQLQTPNERNHMYTASLKGTLYYIPDLSSGVVRRFKSYTTVDVYAKNGDWYYVELYADGYYSGWVYKSQLTF